MDTKKLRQKILDLAIRGKLVPQDPNDEPASVLLERIRAEKERLIAEGKIKRPKKSKASSASSHYGQFEPPFPIPDSWEWVRLEDICICITDGDHQAPPKSKSGIPFLVISDIITGKINFDNCRYVTEEYFKNLENIRKPTFGDILFTVTGSFGKSVIVDTTCKFCFQRHIGLLKPIISSYFLDIVLSSNYIQKECEVKATGTAQKTVSLEVLRNLLIPVPPNNEQLKIVNSVNSFVESLDKVILSVDKLQSNIENAKLKILDLAMQGKLVPQDPTDEPAADMLRRINPKAKIISDIQHYPRWVSTQLGEVCEFERGITFPSTAKEHIKTMNNIACLRTANIHEEVDLSSLWFIDKSFLKGNSNKLIRPGDIIMSTANSKELVGRSVIIKSCEDEMTFGGFVTAIRTSILDPMFLQLFLKFKNIKGDFSKIATQTTNIANLNTKILSSVNISFPCLTEQKRIVAKIEEVYSILDAIETSLQS